MAEFYHDCVSVTADQAVHLQKADGSVIMLDTPQYYMLEVGERVVATVKRFMLLKTDFCILKAPDGLVHIIDGRNEANRAFFLKPFYQFVEFSDGPDKPTMTILSSLPTFLSHKFMVRTSDNVTLNLDIRISYQVHDIQVFCANPIEFNGYMRNYTQNEVRPQLRISILFVSSSL